MARRTVKHKEKAFAVKPKFQFKQYESEFDPKSVEIKSIEQLIANAQAGKTEIFAEMLEINSSTKKMRRKLYNQAQFIEAVKNHSDRINSNFAKMREGSLDAFNSFNGGPVLSLVGDDFVPLLAGPINKQQYLQSYLAAQAECFFAYHHDPFCRGAVNILKHFTLGKGYRADCDDKYALATWSAFEQVNNIPDMLGFASIEIPVQGEIMTYWIPDNAVYVSIDNPKILQAPKGIIPRIRLLDTSAIWEVITLPEDITKVFAYQQVYISQYQTYSTTYEGTQVPIAKTIIRQIPADQVDHYKVNCLSGEKRGRSDMYPVLGFAKRLRDTIQYAVVNTQKSAAFVFDTEVDGGPDDLQAYAEAVQGLGQMPEAGTDFIHSKKVKRQVLSPTGHGGTQSAFDWCLSAFCAGFGIPINFLGTHLSGGQTKASALTATEPAYKRFEDRQILYKRILNDMAQRLFKINGIEAKIEFTFPDLLNQDRTAKMNQLLLGQEAGWFERERCANMAAAELGISDFKFDQEKTEAPPEEAPKPLSTPSTYAGGEDASVSGVTSADRNTARGNQ